MWPDDDGMHAALPEMLETAVGDGGEAFSVGERQLLCLARSILAESKLLIMDGD